MDPLEPSAADRARARSVKLRKYAAYGGVGVVATSTLVALVVVFVKQPFNPMPPPVRIALAVTVGAFLLGFFVWYVTRSPRE